MKPYTVIFALTVALLWGIVSIVHKYALHKIPVITLLAVNTIVYTLALTPLLVFNREKIMASLPALDAKLTIILVLTSIFCILIPNLIFLQILKQNNSYVVTALTYTAPIFTTILGYLLLKEKLTLATGSGVFFIVLGIMLLSKYSSEESQTESFMM